MNTDTIKHGNSQVTFLEIDKLQPNPFQPREKVIEDADFLELVDSVKKHGILEPLVVVNTPAGLHIIAGERRWRAAKKNGLDKVPVHLVKTNPRGMLEMAIVENVQRVNLSPLEKAQAFNRLINEFGYTQLEIGEQIGKSRSYIQCAISLLALPDPIKDGLNADKITEGHARAILTAGNEKNMLACYKIILAENATVRRAEALARFYRRQEEVQKPKSRQIAPAVLDVDKYVANWQSSWQSQLQTKAKFSLVDSNSGTRILITLKGDPERRRQDLDKITKAFGEKKS